MKFALIDIERFGARSQLQLDDLSQQLNVVYGPNGSGKSTIINFVRWVLYGSQDDASRRFLSPTQIPAGGSLKVLDGDHRWRVVSRRDDGTANGRLSVSRAAEEVVDDYDRIRLTGVDVEEYKHIFSFGFDQVPSLEQLIRIATASGFALAHDERQIRDVEALNQQLADLQRSYYAMPESADRIAELRERERQIQLQMDEAEQQRRRRLREVEGECEDLQDVIAARRHRLAELESHLCRTDERIQTRRQQLADASSWLAELREEARESDHRRVYEIDQQIEQWQGTLTDIRSRLERLKSQMADWQPAATSTHFASEPAIRVFLDTVGRQIDDIEDDTRHLAWSEEATDHQEYAEYLRSVMRTALQSLHDDVHQMYAEVHRQKSSSLYHDHASELRRLQRCESEFTELIDELGQRRDLMLRSSAAASSHLHATGDVDGNTRDDGLGTRPWQAVEQPARNGSRERRRDLVLEAHLAHLTRHHERLATRLQEIQSDIAASEDRLQALRSDRHHADGDHQMHVLRGELSTVRHRLQQAEDRLRCREQIEVLQREIESRKSSLGPSDILLEASSWLDRMTSRAYRRVRITEHHEIWLEDAETRRVASRELSRGTLDQVYLSLCLALVAAYYRRGVELPLILNDVFVNIDAERAHATASVLEEFASRGHQTIVFTRHEHVLQLFPNSRGRRFKLQERATAEVEPTVRSAGAPRYLDHAPTQNARRYEPPSRNTQRERSRDWVAQWDDPHRGRTEIATTPVRQNGHQLTEETPLAQVECLDEQVVARFREIQVHNVRLLLDLDPESGQQQLASYGITAAKIHRWQAEIMLQCYVGLTANDAGLLVGCGVDDPQELAYVDVSELHRRIEQFLSSDQHRSRFGAISRYERSRLSRWIQAARQSRFRKAHRHSGYARERMNVRPAAPQNEPRPATEAHPEQSRATTTPERDLPLRFFLELTDAVVDAPSIGPKTAERLNAVGIVTIADLLDRVPEETAEKINYRRITPRLIREWQLQTRLVCRVPNLRGHDAQVLVACEIISPEQLADCSADELHGEIKRFLRTSEGKRILRNGRKPDLAEVTAWIQWAENARTLQSA